MSYILDALKKSEQERARGTIPDIKAVHHTRSAENKKTSYWRYILLAVLLINATGLGFWIYQKNRQVTEENQQTADMTPEAGVDDSVSFEIPTTGIAENVSENSQNTQEQLARNLAALENQGAQQTEQQSTPAKSQTPDVNKSPTQSSARSNVVFSKEPLSATDMENAETVDDDAAAIKDTDITSQNQITTAAAEARENVAKKLYEIAELPADVKRNLPEISFAGHVYSSSKSQRSVMMNGKKMREGQEVTKGLLLEEITMEGVILRSQGYRFKLGALQDWSF